MSKILIVDDDAAFLNSTSEMLTKEGFEVITASNKGECLTMAEGDSPNLILLDVALDGAEDGLEAAQELMTKGVHIPVIILENVAKVAVMSIEASELIEAYAEKPIDKEKLLSKIKIILGR